MTNDRRAEIEAMLAAITQDDWYVERHDYYDGLHLTDRTIEPSIALILGNSPADDPPYGPLSEANAVFIAAAPAIVRELLDEIDRLQERWDDRPWNE